MSSDSADSHQLYGSYIILFTFISILFGACLKYVSLKIGLPYTPTVFALGIILGLASDWLHSLGDSVNFVHNIEPHLILMIFLPALIFDSGFNLSWHTFRKELTQILVLAGPGIIVAAVIQALFFSYVMGYESSFSFTDSLLFGAILAATDPVAVVALLKELGASQSLSTLIEGESLLNDGTAIVLFNVLLVIVKGEEEITGGSVIKLFARLAIGGPTLGLGFAIALSILLSRIYDIVPIEVSFVFAASYLLFYVCEFTSVAMSGVLALVAFGLFMSDYGRTQLSKSSGHALHAFWAFLSFSSETIIFILAGLIIGEKLAKHIDIDGYDWAMIIPFYLVLTLARSLMIFLAYPILRAFGYGTTWKECLVMVHAGLRGGVSLVLALTVFNDHSLPKTQRDKIFFFTSAIVIFTIVFNGLTCGPLVRILGLTRENFYQVKLYNKIVSNMMQSSEREIENKLKKRKFLSMVDWEKAKRIVYDDKYERELKKYGASFKHGTVINDQRALWEKGSGSFNFQNLDLIDSKKIYVGADPQVEIMKVARKRFTSIVKLLHWKEFERGHCKGSTVLKLLESSNKTLDRLGENLSDWKILSRLYHSEGYWRLIKYVSNSKTLSKLFNPLVQRFVAEQYEMASTFIHNYETGIQILSKYNFSTEILEEIRKEASLNVALASEYLQEYIYSDFLEIVFALQNWKAAKAILHHQQDYIKEIYKSGILDEKDYYDLLALIRHSHRRISHQTPLKMQITMKEIFPKFVLLRHYFSDEEIQKLLELSSETHYQKGDVILKEGEKPMFVYAVIKGILSSQLGTIYDRKLQIGDIFEVYHMIGSVQATLTSLSASSPSIVSATPLSAFEAIMTKEKREKIWRDSFPGIINIQGRSMFNLEFLSQKKIQKILNVSSYQELSPDAEGLINPNGMILLSGSLLVTSSLPQDATKTTENEDKHITINTANQSTCYAFRFLRNGAFKVLETAMFFTPEKPLDVLLRRNSKFGTEEKTQKEKNLKGKFPSSLDFFSELQPLRFNQNQQS